MVDGKMIDSKMVRWWTSVISQANSFAMSDESSHCNLPHQVTTQIRRLGIYISRNILLMKDFLTQHCISLIDGRGLRKELHLCKETWVAMCFVLVLNHNRAFLS